MAETNKDATQPETESTNAPGAPMKNGKHDVWTHRIVVCILGSVVLASVLDMTVLQALGKEIPPALANIAASAIGPLAMALGHIMGKH